MPKYKYRFCDGTVKEIEISDADFTRLKDMDDRERKNNRRHMRRDTPLARYVWKEEKPDRARDEEFLEDNA